MKKIVVYQKPSCSKCRALLKNLDERGIEHTDVNYYEQGFSVNTLKDLLSKMKLRPQDILRTSEPIYKQLEIGKNNFSDEKLFDLMVKYPDLIQRPIVVNGNRVVLARPIERVDEVI